MAKKEMLANAYRDSSKCSIDKTIDLKEAIKLDNEIYEWKRNLFGDNNKSVIEAYETLIYDNFVCTNEARWIEEQANLIERCEQIFGNEDLFYLKRFINFSIMLSAVKKYEDALKIDEFLYCSFYKKLGQFHHYTIGCFIL